MITVEQILLKKGSDVITALPNTSVFDAARSMAEANVGALIIEQDDKPVGIVTERDLLRRVLAEDRHPKTTLISEVMSAPVKTCHPADDVKACGKIMATTHIRHLAVLDKDELVGVISLRDILVALHPED